MSNAFDILKKLPDGGIVWIETAQSLEIARVRIKLFASYKPGEYVIFSQESQAVISMPWVPFAREGAPAGPGAKQKQETKQDSVARGPVAPSVNNANAIRVIADIVADVARTLRHKA